MRSLVFIWLNYTLTKYTPFKWLFDKILCKLFENVVCTCMREKMRVKQISHIFFSLRILTMWLFFHVHVWSLSCTFICNWYCIVLAERRHIYCWISNSTVLLYLHCGVCVSAYGNCLNFSDLLLQYEFLANGRACPYPHVHTYIWTADMP